jgi:hypothetical protein
MGWRGLLRVIDFQALLAGQAEVRAAMDRTQRAAGTKSPEVKALREGYYLLAKVLWTRRASIPRVHDLAWLDHTVVSAGTRLGRVWSGDAGHKSVTALEQAGTDPVFRDLFPEKGSDWVDVPVEAFAAISPTVKLERGVNESFRVGIVPEPNLRRLYEAAGTAKFNAPPEAVSALGELEALSAAARRGGRPSVAIVFAASSFEDLPAE